MPRQKLRSPIIRTLWLLSFISTALLLPSCGSVPIHDSQWCGVSRQPDGTGTLTPTGTCFHTLTNPPVEVLQGQAWTDWLMSTTDPKVCTEASVFADWKGAIEKLCTKTACTYEQQQQIIQAVLNFLNRASMQQVAQVQPAMIQDRLPRQTPEPGGSSPE